MNIDTFKKFYIFTLYKSLILVVIIGGGLLLANKPKDPFKSFILLFFVCLMVSLIFGGIGSYFAGSKSVHYKVKDETLAVSLISNILNKAGYSNKEEKNGELIFTAQPHIDKYYGKVYLKVFDKIVEVQAPKILFIKYLNRVRVQ